MSNWPLMLESGYQGTRALGVYGLCTVKPDYSGDPS